MQDHFSFNRLAWLYDFFLPKREPIEFLDALNPHPNDEILEIGAGTGRITKFYSDKVQHLVLLDPSDKMLEKAKEKVPKAEIRLGIVENMEFNDQSFNKIVAYDSLHHWINHNKGLGEIFRVLEEEGEFFVIDINPETIRGKLLILLERLLGMGSNFFSPGKLTSMLKAQKFDDIEYYKVGNGMTYMLHAKKNGKLGSELVNQA